MTALDSIGYDEAAEECTSVSVNSVCCAVTEQPAQHKPIRVGGDVVEAEVFFPPKLEILAQLS